MRRCLNLAKLGAGYVAPNPLVGAVLVHEGSIIGEGWHKQYGEAHAEVNCIASVKEKDRQLIPLSTLYVSLEPCAHFGKTPPCTDLIMKYKIPRVIIGCLDPFKEVDARLNPARPPVPLPDLVIQAGVRTGMTPRLTESFGQGSDGDTVGQGRGIEKLKAAGIEVELGLLEKECKELNKRFFTFHTLHRPYVVLKWAQTADGIISTSPQTPLQRRGASGDPESSRLFISNEYSNRLVHKWRSEEAAILVGTNTVLLDDPELTTRLWPGPSPIRLVVDMDLKLPSSLKIFNDASPTIIFNTKVHSKESEWSAPSPSERVGVRSLHWQVTEDTSLVQQIMNALYQLKIQSVLVEGGAKLLQSFIDEGIWDEARVISNRQLTIGKGLDAPHLENAIKIEEQNILSDTIEFFNPQKWPTDSLS